MGYFIDKNSNYYEGDQQGSDQAVTQRPGPSYAWVSNAWVQSLSKAQVAQIATLSAACQAQIYAGFTSSALGAVHTYPAKDKDQANLSGSVVASLLPGLPTNWTTQFWCEDSTGAWAFVPHTAAEIQQVGTDGKAAIVTALEKNATLAAQVMAATTVVDVQAVVW